jgi:hypothetical protein
MEDGGQSMTSVQELLKAHGIELDSYEPGQHYVTCPECSAKRSREHQTIKVLGVLIEPGGKVIWHCCHCDWSGPSKGTGGGHKTELPFYIYRDRDGVVRFRKVRNRPNKQPRFWLEQPNGAGWKKGTKGVDTIILYRADEVAKAIEAGREICVVEGEKDADNLWRLDIPATCNAHGASELGKKPKWTAAHSAQLKGADIIIFNDNDAPGYAHADTTRKLSLGVAKRVRRLDLKNDWPEIPKGGDVSDWLAVDGHTPERLRELIANASAVAGDPKPEPQAKKAADILIELSAGAEELFHTPDGTAFASIPIDNHLETWPVRSKGFRRWLAREFFIKTSSAPNSDAIQSALNVIEARAHFDGKQRPVYIRVGACERRLYLDLADAQWRTVEIDGDGWRIIDRPPIAFRRPAGMQALPRRIAQRSAQLLERRGRQRSGFRSRCKLHSCGIARSRPVSGLMSRRRTRFG